VDLLEPLGLEISRVVAALSEDLSSSINLRPDD